MWRYHGQTLETEPGTGEPIGVLDTGIDAAHPQFRNKSIIQWFLPDATGEDGSKAELRRPVGRTKSGEVVRDAVALGLEPSGRQVDLELHWQRPLEHGELRLGAVLSREPGHRRHEDPDLFLLAGWKVAF